MSLCIPSWGQQAAADDNAPIGDPPIRQQTGQQIDDTSSQDYIAPALSEDVIIVYGALPDKPFQRDTQLRITGAELRKRGISNLAEALDILPEINVRPAGRGGRQIDIRGARKGSVKVLLDGIAISDPFYGNIDISAIPVTDIEEIRISSSPASPIDGPGGPGGVVEIFTSDAVGPDMLRLRVRAASHPSAEVSVTGRTSLTPSWGLRMSISSMLGAEEFELRLPDENSSEPSSFFLSEARDQSVANARIEYKKGERRLATDIWLQQVAFVVPPARDGSSRYLAIEGESQGRLGLAYDDRWKQFRVQLHAHYHLLSRQSTYYEDPQLTVGAQSEDLNAARAGLGFVANRKLGRDLQLIAQATLESENAEVDGFDGVNTIGRASIAQSALGLAYRG
ncbi:MAG: Plug domain-containing protein, partial [Kofleriaceae bacterium]|nr:Plug domain-containing protein [Kofleriaceae bacterium]